KWNGRSHSSEINNMKYFPHQSKIVNRKSKIKTLLIVALVTLGLVAAIAGFAPATPSIYGISPTNCYQNSTAFTLTVGGYNFVSGSTILWNGSPRTTNFVSSRVLNAQISTTDVSSPGLIPVSV